MKTRWDEFVELFQRVQKATGKKWLTKSELRNGFRGRYYDEPLHPYFEYRERFVQLIFSHMVDGEIRVRRNAKGRLELALRECVRLK